MSYYINPFSATQLNSAVSNLVKWNQQIGEVLSISYISTSKYWMVVQDSLGRDMIFIRPNSNGDITLPYEIRDFLNIYRDTSLPAQDLGVSNPQFKIRFNNARSSIGITNNVNDNGSDGSTVIVSNVVHAIVDSGNIDVDSVVGDVQVVNGSSAFHVDVDNFPAVQGISIADGSDISLGAKSDIAASSDTGSFSVISFIKRAMQNWTSLLSRIPGALGTGGGIKIDQVSDNVVGSEGNSANGLAISAGGYTNGVDTQFCTAINIFGIVSGSTTLTVSVSQDGLTWYDSGITQMPTTTFVFSGTLYGARYIRLKSSAAVTITATIAGKG